jgi:hypothetical protein
MASTRNGLVLCKLYINPKMGKDNILQKMQGVRKDVEKCFEILQFWFSIIQNPCKLWQMNTIYKIMIACTHDYIHVYDNWIWEG